MGAGTSIRMVCVVLAGAAPALAVSFYEVGPNSDSGVCSTVTYNPTPNPVDVVAWEDAYTPPYSPYVPSPYYEYQGATSGWHPTTADDVRFNANFADLYIQNGTFSANSFHIGDSYWPNGYATTGNTFTQHRVFQYGQNVAINNYNMGRVAGEMTTPSMAATNYWRVLNGSLNIGTLRQLNTDTQDTLPSTRFAWHRHTVGGISTGGAQNDNVSVTIGDIYLNQTWTYLLMNAGTWNLTGDIVQQGNLVAILTGWRGPPGATPDLTMGAELTMKWSTLYDMIDHGQFFTRYGGNALNLAPGQNFLLPDPVGTDSTPATVIAERGIRLITRANMYGEMVMTDLGNGMVKLVVPEPAALALVGVGGLFLVRRRRS